MGLPGRPPIDAFAEPSAPAALPPFGGRLASLNDEGSKLHAGAHAGLDAAVSEVVGLGADPGLGLLLDLAKRGEYDPWNVDIVALTDSYLDALDDQLDAQDLRRVARLIFYAAALIHLKAKALAERQKSLGYEEALEQAFADEFGDLSDSGEGFPRLRPGDQPLDYGFLGDPGGRAAFGPQERPVRERGLTLVDLIVALREYDERLALKEQEFDDEPLFDEDLVLEECVGGSHQDDLGQDIVEVRQELWSSLADAEFVTLASLVGERRSQGAAYLALLFLSQDEEVLLEQEVFYSELRIVKGRYFGEIRAWVINEDEETDEEEEDGDAVTDGGQA